KVVDLIIHYVEYTYSRFKKTEFEKSCGCKIVEFNSQVFGIYAKIKNQSESDFITVLWKTLYLDHTTVWWKRLHLDHYDKFFGDIKWNVCYNIMICYYDDKDDIYSTRQVKSANVGDVFRIIVSPLLIKEKCDKPNNSIYITNDSNHKNIIGQLQAVLLAWLSSKLEPYFSGIITKAYDKKILKE
ncbi:30097_t:CDS:2, partial [Racocetra persica]